MDVGALEEAASQFCLTLSSTTSVPTNVSLASRSHTNDSHLQKPLNILTQLPHKSLDNSYFNFVVSFDYNTNFFLCAQFS